MSSSEIFITKRDGKRERFSIDKIRAAIAKAFLSVGSFATDEMLTQILGRIRVADGTTVEQIQNQVETALMAERYYKVAKAYIIYRQEHTEDREVRDKLQFLMNYCEAKNPATGSKYDANANVENKNIATLIGELPKQNFIRLNRRLLTDRLKEMYGKEVSDRYLELLDRHFIYKNDETSLANYCASITMYPWLLSGTTSIGGNSTRPTNLKSFCGGFVNMVFIVSSMLSGACATPEFLMYMNYFIAQEFGEDYYRRADEVVDLSRHRRTIDKVITDCFEQVVYSINQPTGARNFQAVFWNIAYYDRYYFESLFGEFRFPDGSRPDWEGLSWLQKRFMKWFNAERLKTVLTFPVETMALLTRDGDVMDAEWGDFTAQMYAEGHSFFTYMSDNADSLSSCCRLRNEIQDNGFSYTLGAGGVSTGSKSVLTINLNRCIQYAERQGIPYLSFLEEVVDLTHKVQLAYNENLKELQRKGMLPLFDAGYINLSRQYLTIGINGLVEAAEYKGIAIVDNPDYVRFTEEILGLIERYNHKYRSKEVMFNCEMIPAENVGVKHAKWDREDGYKVPRDCYNSYFYVVEDTTLNIADKFRLHGAQYIAHLTGGSALHMNLEEHLSQPQYRHLLRVAAQEGCNYFTFNIPNTVCNDCGHIDKRYLKECPRCHSTNLDYLTRVIGYMKRISNFSQARQQEAARRRRAQRGGTATRRIDDGHASLHRLRHRVPRDPRRDDARRQPRGMPQPLPGLPQPAVAGADRRTAHRGGRGAAAGALRRCGHLLLPDGRRRRTARGSAAGALRPPAAARPAHGVVLRTCGVARRVRSDGSFRLRETRPLHRCAGAARRSGDQPAAMAHPARRPARRSHAAVLAQTRLKNRSGRALLSPITSDPVSAADRPSSNGRRCCDRLRTDAPRAAEQRTNRRENRAIRKKCLPLRPVLQDSTPEGFVSGVR